MRSHPSSRLRRLIAATALALSLPATAWTPTHQVKTPQGYVLLRPLTDRSVLFAFSPGQTAPTSIEESPMWAPEAASKNKGTEKTEDLALGEDLDFGEGAASLHVFLDPATREPALEVKQGTGKTATSYRLDFANATAKNTSFRLRAPNTDHLAGLGEQLPPESLGKIDGDLMGTVRYSGMNIDSEANDPKGVYGNSMVKLAGGAAANALFPVLHVIDDNGPDALLFLDNIANSRWDMRTSPWKVELRNGEISGALAWGRETAELRQEYLSWTGHSPIPPRKAFGMWVSEYGFESWDEIESKAKGLKDAEFPVDGFVMDLQWFGGIAEKSRDSRMGSLTFDTKAFPEPAAHIADFARRGLGIIVIEEPYIASGLPEYADLAKRQFLVRSSKKPTEPLEIDETPWWGLGSMLDYTNPEAAKYWHQTKREAIRKLGVLGHWTDLGEPEMFRHITSKGKETTYETPLYHDDRNQLEANNVFAIRWAQSIFDGYGADGHEAGQRPFIIGRTGTAGIQRFGAALWSGDIGANWESLRSHYRAQANVALSGVDYFGSDVGGFYRNAYTDSPGGYNELYTRWFAAACLTDVPLRPHTMNLSGKYETAPNLVGHTASNLENLRQRYRLIPYLYASAHSTWKNAAPFIAPPIAHEQGQDALDVSGSHKWIGADLFARLILEPNVENVAVTLPKGRWYDFESGEKVSEGGGETLTIPARFGDIRRTPLYARGGSLIPVGSPSTSAPDPEHLELLVFPGKDAGTGLVYEDDGESEEYRGGKFATTQLKQTAWRGRYGQVTIEPRAGLMTAELGGTRDVVLRVASEAKTLTAVVDEVEIPAEQEGGFWTIRLGERSADTPLVVNFR